MSKAFTKEDAPDDAVEPEEGFEPQPVAAGGKNYISSAGFARLKAELRELV